jgi:hypothetical protein
MRALIQWLWTAVRRLAQPVWRFVTRWVATAQHGVVSFVHGVQERHQMRMETDASYPVSIVSGSTAVLGVLAASPAIAASLAVLLTEWLGLSRRHTTAYSSRPSSTYSRRSWEDERESARLWDRTDWDED